MPTIRPASLSHLSGLVLLLAACLALLAACGSDPLPDYQSGERTYQAVHVPDNGNTPEGAAYARNLLAKDPRRETITEAFVRDDQLVGVVVRPAVRGEVLRDIMLGLVVDMADEFPNRDVEAVAYNEGDKRTVARAVYRADSGQTSYESVR